MRNLISISGEISATFHARIFKPNRFSYQPLHIDKLNFASKQCNGYNYTDQSNTKFIEQWLKDPTEKQTIYNFIAVQK
jgi:hypothetical protein